MQCGNLTADFCSSTGLDCSPSMVRNAGPLLGALEVELLVLFLKVPCEVVTADVSISTGLDRSLAMARTNGAVSHEDHEAPRGWVSRLKIMRMVTEVLYHVGFGD